MAKTPTNKQSEPTIETVHDDAVAAANAQPSDPQPGDSGKPDTSERARQLTMGQARGAS